MPKMKTFKAKWAFNPGATDELALIPGELIDVSTFHDGDWGEGVSRRTQQRGTFPWSFVEEYQNKETKHAPIPTRLIKPKLCGYCKDFIWGRGKDAFKCTECDVVWHTSCRKSAQNKTDFECSRTVESSGTEESEYDMVPKMQAGGGADMSKCIDAWSCSDVLFWLRAIRMEDYEFIFNEKNVNGNRLQLLNDKNLKTEYGMEDSGHITLMLASVEELMTGRSKTAPPGGFAARCQASCDVSMDVFDQADFLVLPDSAKDPLTIQSCQVVRDHYFKRKSFMNPVWCDVCTKYLWGAARQGVQCFDCGLVAHHMCKESAELCKPAEKQIKILSLVHPGQQKGYAFGETLENQMDESDRVPKILVALLAALNNPKALKEKLIYRKNPPTKTIRAFKEALLQNQDVKIEKFDAICMAWFLKRYFVELPEAIIPGMMIQKFTACVGRPPAEQTLLLQQAIAGLATENQNVLNELLRHLGKVVTASADNKVDLVQLSNVWAPIILRPTEENIEKSVQAIEHFSLVTSLLIRLIGGGSEPPPVVPRSGKKTSTGALGNPSGNYENVSLSKPEASVLTGYETVVLLQPGGPSVGPAVPTVPRLPRNEAGRSAQTRSVKNRTAAAAETGVANLVDQAWFGGYLDRAVAESKMTNTPTGTFMLRKKKNTAGFVLSVKYGRDVRHIVIKEVDGRVGFVELEYDNIMELVAHFQNNSLKKYNKEMETTLKFPFKTAPQNVVNTDTTEYEEEPDEDIYMSNVEAIRKQQAPTELVIDTVNLQRLHKKLKAEQQISEWLTEALSTYVDNYKTDEQRRSTSESRGLLEENNQKYEKKLQMTLADIKREKEHPTAEATILEKSATLPRPRSTTSSSSFQDTSIHPIEERPDSYLESAFGSTGVGSLKLLSIDDLNHDNVELKNAQLKQFRDKFYVGKMERKAAEALLEGKVDGTFLLRESEKGTEKSFVIAMRFEDVCKHIQIKSNEEGTLFGLAEPYAFISPELLVSYYLQNPLSQKIPCTLKYGIHQQ